LSSKNSFQQNANARAHRTLHSVLNEPSSTFSEKRYVNMWNDDFTPPIPVDPSIQNKQLQRE
jgi:hypothetical protein